jgi:hypothetical protein
MMMLLVLVWNLVPLTRMLLRLRQTETRMQNDQDEKRTPAETERLTREVMKRMLQTPPKPHEDALKKKKAAKKKSK